MSTFYGVLDPTMIANHLIAPLCSPPALRQASHPTPVLSATFVLQPAPAYSPLLLSSRLCCDKTLFQICQGHWTTAAGLGHQATRLSIRHSGPLLFHSVIAFTPKSRTLLDLLHFAGPRNRLRSVRGTLLRPRHAAPGLPPQLDPSPSRPAQQAATFGSYVRTPCANLTLFASRRVSSLEPTLYLWRTHPLEVVHLHRPLPQSRPSPGLRRPRLELQSHCPGRILGCSVFQ
ncbi:hypothetical protein HBH98_042570 [Parastagonospora nodorum]|nr:hypothetical protein HBH53_083450 [Parastagonospora nodorum]KAH3975778.1 hypothetical protein HBH51_081930 [Parastagonospora nodorum]KAH4039192.1 hypothetical protein HBI09_045150 [Parastagonospora nodorum]KAH4175708.1 hypothetical protein HBH43_065910 [Parastagonospora nodorum]KAH4194997.1 hypothetical protein HBH42_087690 [Parastagonospora nodorum]